MVRSLQVLKVKLSILFRLFLGYFFLLILATGMSVYAIVQLGRVTDVTRSIILVDNALMSHIKDLTDTLLSETRYEKKYLIEQDSALYESFLKSQGEFKQYLNEARLLNISNEARDVLDNVADFHLTYNALFQEETDYLKDGLNYNREWYTEEKERAVNAAIEALVKIRLLSQQGIFDKVKNLSEAGTRARSIAIAVSAVLLMAGILLAVLKPGASRSLSHSCRRRRRISLKACSKRT